MYLLDNNVVSEIWKSKPEPTVLAFVYDNQWLIPVPVLAEIQEGTEAHPSEARRIQLNRQLDRFLSQYHDVVLDWDADTARIWGRLRHSQELKNQPQSLWDSLIDALAVRHNAIVVTRNEKDFRHAKTLNPWP